MKSEIEVSRSNGLAHVGKAGCLVLGVTFLLACAQQSTGASQSAPAQPLGSALISKPLPAAGTGAASAMSGALAQAVKPYEIETGEFICGMGGKLVVQKDGAAGLYAVSAPSEKRSFKMRVTPVTSGAVRLDDVNKAGFLLILANKSMLFDAKKGSRIADNCITPMQKQFQAKS